MQWTEDVEDNPDLDTRWRDAIKRKRAFSKMGLMEFTRRSIRVNVLLGIIEQQYLRRETSIIEIKQVGGSIRRTLISIAAVICVLLVLDFLLIWPIDEITFTVLAAFLIFILVFGNLERAPLERERASACRALAIAILELEEISGERFQSYDFELLDEHMNLYMREVARKYKFEEIDKRRAEFSVNMMASLVGRVEILDDAEPIQP